MTTKHIELVGKKEFIAVVFDLEYETFLVYVASLSSFDLDIYLSCKPQVAGLISKEIFIIISAIIVLIASMVIITIFILKTKIVAIAIICFLLLDKLR